MIGPLAAASWVTAFANTDQTIYREPARPQHPRPPQAALLNAPSALSVAGGWRGEQGKLRALPLRDRSIARSIDFAINPLRTVDPSVAAVRETLTERVRLATREVLSAD